MGNKIELIKTPYGDDRYKFEIPGRESVKIEKSDKDRRAVDLLKARGFILKDDKVEITYKDDNP